MKRKDFLKLLCFGYLGLRINDSMLKLIFLKGGIAKEKLNNWIWVPAHLNKSLHEWKSLFAKFRSAGVNAILANVYDSRYAYYASQYLPVREPWLEKILPLAKGEGLEFHSWIWCMPCNIERIHQEHPEWFCVNRKGESALEKPAYVKYYKFLCPNRPEVHQHLLMILSELARYDEIDGIHLDYIRYPDVILPEMLQSKYHIVQDLEYPEYDYCYCEVCRKKFKEKTGFDPLKLEEPTSYEEWNQFRYDSITNIVNNKLVPIARKHDKKITAAVFPNWKMVRQQWYKWNLDAFMPMLYHKFYNGDIDWISQQTEIGVTSLAKGKQLYSGLFIPQLSPEELVIAIEAAINSGAKGVSLFSAFRISDAYWQSFQEAVKRILLNKY